jgi:hypothetical protein
MWQEFAMSIDNQLDSFERTNQQYQAAPDQLKMYSRIGGARGSDGRVANYDAKNEASETDSKVLPKIHVQGQASGHNAQTGDASTTKSGSDTATVEHQLEAQVHQMLGRLKQFTGELAELGSGANGGGSGTRECPAEAPHIASPPVAIDNPPTTPPETTTPPVDNPPASVPDTPVVTTPSTPDAPTTPPAAPESPGVTSPSSYSAANDLAAAESIGSMPAGESSLSNAGATDTPAPLANPQDLAPVTVNGNDDIESVLGGLGTLTENNGTYTLDANGNQLPPLVLNDVTNLNITNANFANVSGSGAVTINGDSSGISITNSNFTNISSGVDIYPVNGIMPSGITVDGNSFSNITGPWPSASAVQFAGSGSGEVAADPNGINSVSNNTVIDGTSLASPNSTNAGLSGQDIISDYNNPYSLPTVISNNFIDGSYMTADGSHPPDSAVMAELSNNVWIAGNFVENQSSSGVGDAGSTNVTVTGNYIQNAISAYFNSAEGGINPTGTWTYNNADTSPQAGSGWPEIYASAGLPNAPGGTNNWNQFV